MQVRVMAACMESQSHIRSAQSRPRDGRGVSDVCVVDSSILNDVRLELNFVVSGNQMEVSIVFNRNPNNYEISGYVWRH